MNDATPRPGPDRQAAAAALLGWLADLGITDLVQDAPRDRFAETAREAEARLHRRGAPRAASEPAAAPALARTPAATLAREETPAARPAAAFAPTLTEAEAVDDARARARAAGSLEDLEAALAGFTGCTLSRTARSLVFGSGAKGAALMIVGDPPGREEDEAGAPFVGRPGRLLDAMLAAIGLERGAVRLANAVPWRPPGNRAPTPAETEMCLPFLLRHVELVRPRVLLALGSRSAKVLLGTEENMMRLRGRWLEVPLGDGRAQAIVPSFHPDYLLTHPAHKRLAWADLLAVKERLAEV